MEWKSEKAWPSQREFKWKASILGVYFQCKVKDFEFISWLTLLALWWNILRSQRVVLQGTSGFYGVSQRSLAGWVAKEKMVISGKHLGYIGPVLRSMSLIDHDSSSENTVWLVPTAFMLFVKKKSAVEKMKKQYSRKKSSSGSLKKKTFKKKKKMSSKATSETKVTKKKIFRKKKVSQHKKKSVKKSSLKK